MIGGIFPPHSSCLKQDCGEAQIILGNAKNDFKKNFSLSLLTDTQLL